MPVAGCLWEMQSSGSEEKGEAAAETLGLTAKVYDSSSKESQCEELTKSRSVWDTA